MVGISPTMTNSVVPMAKALRSAQAGNGHGALHGKEGRSLGTGFAEKPVYRRITLAAESRMKTTLDELQAFAAVVDAGSITAAASGWARPCPPSAAAWPAGGEARHHPAAPDHPPAGTDRGRRVFLARARGILAAVDGRGADGARREQPAGRLRVDAATPFMLHVVVAYRAAHPQVELELHSNEASST
jgi:hypothetical protein